MTNTTINSRCTPYNINTVLPLLYGIGIKLTNNTNNVKAITIQIYNCRYEFSILIFFVCGRKRKRKKSMPNKYIYNNERIVGACVDMYACVRA